jgi:dCMP deaminase
MKKHQTLSDLLRERRLKWDLRFLEMARLVAGWSKDPSTQTGAVFVGRDNSVISVGYNGFPRPIEDTPERLNDRQTKYSMIVHCEMNAMMSANSSVRGSTLYTWPFMSCDRCAAHMIQAGVTRVVAPKATPDKEERWGEAFKKTRAMFKEAGIPLVEIDLCDASFATSLPPLKAPSKKGFFGWFLVPSFFSLSRHD